MPKHDKNKPLKVTSEKKATIKRENIFVEKRLSIDGVDKMAYIIFFYKELYNMFGLSSDDINIIIYLKELWIFPISIKILDDFVRLKPLYEKGFIKEDYSNNNERFYCLSEKGLKVVDMLNDFSTNYSEYVKENRVTDLGLNAKIDSILSRAYKK